MRVTAAAALVIVAAFEAGAVDRVLTPTAVTEALKIGQSRVDRDRARYHDAYRIILNKAPVDYIEVVTPFRRVVQAAETRALIGDRSFSQRQGLELAAAAGSQLDVRAEFTFHPLHTFVGVPNYLIRLEGAGRLEPDGYDRIPRFGARVDGPTLTLPVPGGRAPGDTQPMLGGAVVARFDAAAIMTTGVYDVVVEEAGKELARARVDFARLR